MIVDGRREKTADSHVNLRNAKGGSSVTSGKNAQKHTEKMDIKREEEAFNKTKVHFVIVLIYL